MRPSNQTGGRRVLLPLLAPTLFGLWLFFCAQSDAHNNERQHAAPTTHHRKVNRVIIGWEFFCSSFTRQIRATLAFSVQGTDIAQSFQTK